MADEITTSEQLRIAHRRGHSLPLHERAREDVTRANVLVSENGAMLEVGALFDGEMLVVDGTQIVSEPIPGGGGGTVTAGAGLDGDGSALDPLTIVRGTGVDQTRHGNDAAYTNARTPLAHTHIPSEVGLTNVTNDAQLKRAGADWSAFTAQTPVLYNDTVLIEQATGGAKRRVEAVDVAKSIVAYYGFLPTPVTGIGTTPVLLFSASLEPGTYIMSATLAYGVATVTGTRTFSLDLALDSGTISLISGFGGKPGHNASLAQQGSTGISALPYTLNNAFVTNNNGLAVMSAVVTVASTAVISLRGSLSGDSTGFVRAGAVLQFTR